MNQQYVVNKNVADIYATPSSEAERVTQAIMGEHVTILTSSGKWSLVQTWDKYKGWIENSYLTPKRHRNEPRIQINTLFAKALSSPDSLSNVITELVIATTLPLLEEGPLFTRVRLPDNSEAWIANSNLGPPVRRTTRVPNGLEIMKTASRFLGVPYLWGGTTPFGIDCSGFVQLVYRLHGFWLPRDAAMQATYPQLTIGNGEPGELLFFSSDKTKRLVTHVGISYGNGKFIHSASKIGVTISHLDDEPYKHRLLGIKRLSY